MQDETEPAAAKPPWKRWAKRLLHVVVLGVTLAAISGHMVRAYGEMKQHPLQMDYRWLAASVLCYAAGLMILGIPWALAVRDSGVLMSRWAAVQIYVISHVGKYVPGKAMPLVIRYGLGSAFGLTVGIVAVTTFFETFLTMGTGSLLGLVCLVGFPQPAELETFLKERPWILLVAAVLATGFCVSVLPPVFQRGIRLVTLPFEAARRFQAKPIRWETLGLGFLADILSWTLQGMSFWAVERALVGDSFGWNALPAATAAAGLSVSLGFVSMLPGQLGVRDLVLIEAMLPLVGAERIATAGAVLHRLVTLAVELSLGGLFYLVGRRR